MIRVRDGCPGEARKGDLAPPESFSTRGAPSLIFLPAASRALNISLHRDKYITTVYIDHRPCLSLSCGYQLARALLPSLLPFVMEASFHPFSLQTQFTT